MHRCLRVQELLTNIFLFIPDPDNPDPDDESFIMGNKGEWPSRQSAFFAGLARTCTAFRDPALDILWRSQASLTPLIRVLPQDAISRHEDTLRPARNLFPEDYSRVLYYGRRIRSLGIPTRWSTNMDLASPNTLLYSFFWDQRPAALPILPRLVHVEFDISDFDELAIYPRLAIGPTIKSILIDVDEMVTAVSKARWGDVKAVLASTAPRLQAFSIKGIRPHYPLDFGVVPEILFLCRSFHRIQSIDAHSVPLTSIELLHLATMRQLKTIMFSVADSEFSQFLSAPTSEEHFSGVENFQFEVVSLDLCIAFFRRPGFGQLQSLLITRRCSADKIWNIAMFIETLGDQLKHFKLLKSLSLINFDEDIFFNFDPTTNVTPVTPTILAHIFPLKLEELRIDLGSRMALDNECISSIGKAWPNLRVLELADRTEDMIPAVTLNGLIPLLSSCPNLVKLTVRVDAQPEVAIRNVGDIHGGKNIRQLDLCTSPIGDRYEPGIPAFLSLAFPQLQRLEYGAFEDMAMFERWRDVHLQLIALIGEFNV